MKRKNSKWINLVIGLFVCASALTLIAACGRNSGRGAVANSADNVNPPGVFPIVKEPITIKVGIRQNSSVEDYETNYYTQMLEEKGNLKLEFELFPGDVSGTERLLVMVAGGGELPEVLVDFSFSDEVMYSLGQEGVALKLNDYYENWAYYFPTQMEKVSNKSMWQWMHSADGNIYFLPFIQEQVGEYYSLRGWMNQRWLSNLGLSMPTTTDEFRRVLEAFRDRDPNGNGSRDEIPAAGNNSARGRIDDFLINAFIYNDTRDRLIVNNGRVDIIYNKPEYREALRYISGLVRDGLMLDQLYTMDGGGLRTLIESQSPVSTIGFFNAGFAGALSPNNEMRLEYVPMAPLRGPQGVGWTPYMPMEPLKKYVITKDAKYPEAAFRLGDLMCSEEASIWSRFGRPGIDYRLARPGERSMYDSIGFSAVLAEILPWGSTQNSHWYTGGALILPLGIIDGQVASDNPLNNEIWIAAAAPLYMDRAPPPENRVDKTILDSREITEMADLKNTINSFVNENLALFVTGQKSIDSEWDAYISELERMGLQRYIQLQQSGYERATGRK
jgi:putative aldouronate transport system substrate-binding protein